MDSSRLFATSLGLACAMAGLALTGLGILAWNCQGSLARMLWLGRPLVAVELPLAGSLVSHTAVPVQIRLLESGAVATHTLYCELDGEDVTERLRASRDELRLTATLVPRGAGVRVLRVGVFGRGWFGAFVEDVVELEFRVRPVAVLDRA